MPDDSTPGAADYLAYARSGDAAALERALRACADGAYTQARRTLGNAADADDAVQEAFLQLVRSAPRFDGRVPFAAWLGRLVQVACQRLRRSDRRRRRREETAMADAPTDPVSNADDMAMAVREQVARLAEADRQVIELHYFGGLARPEVAAALGIGENAVSQRLTRARTRLRELLGRPAVSAAAIGGLLAAQPAYAAPAPVQVGIGSLSATAAAGGSLPATTIPLTLTQEGLLLMSLHPVATALCAGLLALAGTLPVLLWGADAPVPVPHPGPAATATAAAMVPWQGAARQVLPFLAPDAPVRMAADWAHLRTQALDIKPLTLLADPRAQTAVAHVREQFRLWSLAGEGMPDWADLLGKADGAAFVLRWPPPGPAGGPRMLRDGRMQIADATLPWPKPVHCFVSALGEAGAASAQEAMAAIVARSGRPVATATAGPFAGFDLQAEGLAVRSASCWALAHRELLQEGAERGDGVPPPPAPVWARVDGADIIAALAALDRDGDDPLGLGLLLGPDWRTAPPALSATLARDGDEWRSAIALDGIHGLPLRAPSPAIVGCVPQGALASLVLGADPQRLAALLAPWFTAGQAEELLAPLARAGIPLASLPGWLSGDAALVVQPGAPLPAATLVLGLRSGAVDGLRPALEQALSRFGMAAAPAATGALAAWSLATPIGMVQVQLAADRLVAGTGESAAFLAMRPTPADADLALAIDLPALARTYLPLLAARMPAKPTTWAGPLRHLGMRLGGLAALRRSGSATAPIDLDALRSDGSRRGFEVRDGVRRDFDAGQEEIDGLRAEWQRLVGRAGVPINPFLALYGRPGDRRAGVLVLRRADGWRVMDGPDALGEVIADRAALGRRLAGLVLRAGTDPEALKPLDLPDPPTFDRRWLPPVPAIADHLPAYRLRLRTAADGLRAEERGLPLAAFGAVVLATAAAGESRLAQDLHAAAVLRREGPAARVRHQRALAALARAYRAMERRPAAEEPLLTPSRMLAAAGVPLAELASLTGGAEPAAEAVDRLGRWRPTDWPHSHYEWRIPIEKGLFIECAFWRNGVDLTARPAWNIRPLQAGEGERLMARWRERRGAANPAVQAPPAPPPPAVSDF